MVDLLVELLLGIVVLIIRYGFNNNTGGNRVAYPYGCCRVSEDLVFVLLNSKTFWQVRRYIHVYNVQGGVISRVLAKRCDCMEYC